ncbi:MAG: hypothetical protein WC324_06290 [Candidatus Omnitrophota bacterium]|jgi:hypothetical protein
MRNTAAVSFLAALILAYCALCAAEVLDKDLKIGDTVYPKGTQVGYYKSGKLYWAQPKRPLTINGLKCAANYNVIFYPSGKIKQIRLASSAVIDGRRCAANYLTELYESGKLKVCPLAEPAVIDGIKLNNRDFAFFSEDGRLAGMMIHQPVTIKGKKYMPNCEIYLDDKGNVTEEKKLADGVHYY